MSDSSKRFHRLGVPGGPGCEVTALRATGKDDNGNPQAIDFLDAGPNATEVELLRTIAATLGVRWGHDELGWWAAVPVRQ